MKTFFIGIIKCIFLKQNGKYVLFLNNLIYFFILTLTIKYFYVCNENVMSKVSTSLNWIFTSVSHFRCKEKFLPEIREENIQCKLSSFAVGIFTDLTVKPGHLQVQ